MATTIVTESPALVLLNEIRAQYSALTSAERAAVSRNDVAWVAALLHWAADACPEPHRGELLQLAAAAALIAAVCWA
jgi:hypothetical protein